MVGISAHSKHSYVSSYDHCLSCTRLHVWICNFPFQHQMLRSDFFPPPVGAQIVSWLRLCVEAGPVGQHSSKRAARLVTACCHDLRLLNSLLLATELLHSNVLQENKIQLEALLQQSKQVWRKPTEGIPHQVRYLQCFSVLFNFTVFMDCM